MSFRLMFAIALLGVCSPLSAQEPSKPNSLSVSEPGLAIAQLRHVVGGWDVTTEFLQLDGSVAASFEGTYHFEWVVPDAVVRGVSTIPKLNQTSAILFYVRPSQNEIEMVAVGKDGQLWTMTGKDTEETRETPLVSMPDGSSLKLRFTRYNVTQDGFESQMEASTDGGETWVRGNHQVFVRQEPASN